MSVAHGHDVVHRPVDADHDAAPRSPLSVVPQLAGEQRVPARAAAWSAALRLRLLPATLLGPACGALLAVRAPGARPAPVAVAVLLVVAGHGVAVLVRGLGDPRRRWAGALPRRSAGRALLATAAVALLLLGMLLRLAGPPALGWTALGAAAALAGASRRSGPLLTALAGLAAGAGSALLVLQAAGGVPPARALPVAVAAGAVVASLLPARRRLVLPSAAVRALAALPAVAVGAGVALGVLPAPVLVVAAAVPWVRRAVRAPGTGLARAASASGLLVVSGLAAAASLGG